MSNHDVPISIWRAAMTDHNHVPGKLRDHVSQLSGTRGAKDVRRSFSPMATAQEARESQRET